MRQAEPKEIRGELEAVLDRMMRSSAARGVAVARVDGLVIAHRLGPRLDARVAAATAASIFGAAETAARQLDQGGIEEIMIKCNKGNILGLQAGREAIILGIFDKAAALGLVRLELARAGQEVSRILEEVMSA